LNSAPVSEIYLYSRLKDRKWFFVILKHLPLLLWVFIIIVPLMMLVFTSFKDNAEYAHSLPIAPPKHFFNLANYRRTLIEGRILRSMLNSLILVVCGSGLNVMMGAMTAYCLERFEFKVKGLVKSLYITSAIIPHALLNVVIYKIMYMLRLTGTLGAPIILYALPGIVQVWIYLQFFEKLPVSMDESAMIDGASYMRIFIRIIFPLLLPATSTILITQSIAIYNDMFTQYLYCPTTDLKTATTALMTFSGQFATSFNVMAAGCVAVMLPTLALFLILQRYVFAGLTVGAVKG
jgi:multiple sugar transport system permease protein